MIEALSKKLKTHKSFYNVFPITTAKVPIVKFTHRSTRLEGDISLYNTLVSIFNDLNLTLLHSEWPKLHSVLAVLSALVLISGKACITGRKHTY